jgi:hypothetical protein
MKVAQIITETKVSFRVVSNHLQLALFLLIALLISFSTNANAQDDGVRWQAKLDTSNNSRVAITVNPTNLQAGLYITSMKCKVLFFNAANEQIGARVFDFSASNPGSLIANTPPRKKLFRVTFGSATSARGDDMTYKVFRLGSKADEHSTEPEFVADRRRKATP